jgi:RimJ/RimL family protein N-acetyltransferase
MASLTQKLGRCTLENDDVLLRPLDESDFDGLRPIAYDSDIWRFSTGALANDDQLATYLRTARQEREADVRLPFAVVGRASSRVAGSTSYGSISEKNSRLEIGWTWLGREFQGTGLNRQVKYLLLDFALTKLGLERVEFKTDVLNEQARRALLQIGATEEGVLRSHTLMHDGRRRDTIYYSVLHAEWPDIKRRLFADISPLRVIETRAE